jgi:hypothetical protein
MNIPLLPYPFRTLIPLQCVKTKSNIVVGIFGYMHSSILLQPWRLPVDRMTIRMLYLVNVFPCDAARIRPTSCRFKTFECCHFYFLQMHIYSIVSSLPISIEFVYLVLSSPLLTRKQPSWRILVASSPLTGPSSLEFLLL